MTPGEVVRTPLAGAEVEPDSPDVRADEALSLPPAAPGRTAFLRRLALTAVEAINRRDLDGYLSVFHPDVVIRIARLEGGGLWGGDFDEFYRGLEEVRRLLEQWLEPWAESVSSRTRSWIREGTASSPSASGSAPAGAGSRFEPPGRRGSHCAAP